MRNADDVAPMTRLMRWKRLVRAMDFEMVLKVSLLASSLFMGLFTVLAVGRMVVDALQAAVLFVRGLF